MGGDDGAESFAEPHESGRPAGPLCDLDAARTKVLDAAEANKAEEMMTPGQESLIALMNQARIPLTRENYIDAAWGEERPEPWTVEHEAELPDFLRITIGISARSTRRPARSPSRG
jgi:hypothetical protein